MPSERELVMDLQRELAFYFGAYHDQLKHLLDAASCRENECERIKKLLYAAPSPVAAENVDAYNGGLEAAAKVIIDFHDWVWCDCFECKHDARSHAVKTEASLTRVATAIRALKK